MLPTQAASLVSDQSLSESAVKVQKALMDYRGVHYHIDDLKEVLCKWLDSSIEELCEGAAEFCVSGDRNAASFNREIFDLEINELPGLHIIGVEL